MIFRILLIPITGVISNEFATSPFYIHLAADFHGNIPAISVIDKVLERDNHFVGIIVLIHTVIMI